MRISKCGTRCLTVAHQSNKTPHFIILSSSLINLKPSSPSMVPVSEPTKSILKSKTPLEVAALAPLIFKSPEALISLAMAFTLSVGTGRRTMLKGVGIWCKECVCSAVWTWFNTSLWKPLKMPCRNLTGASSHRKQRCTNPWPTCTPLNDLSQETQVLSDSLGAQGTYGLGQPWQADSMETYWEWGWYYVDR